MVGQTAALSLAVAVVVRTQRAQMLHPALAATVALV
jgi:hypothetical protein